LGVTTGIAVLAGLICMVLHLFSKTKYPRTRHFADAHHGPPIMFASDTGKLHVSLKLLNGFNVWLVFQGIPLTLQSNRPSSRSSQRSSGSIGSFTGRRSSGTTKGVTVSQSRQGAARSAAILLFSYHVNALKDQTSCAPYQTNFHNNELMAKYIEQQLEDQKKLLYLDIPTLRNHNSLMRKLRLNPRSEIDLTQLDKQLIGNSPLHRKLHRRFFNQTKTDGNVADERSGVDDFVVNKSTENSDLNGSSESHTHNVSFITDGGYTNPLAFSIDGLESADDTDEDELYIVNQDIYIGALPTPCSEGPAFAVGTKSLSLIVVCEL
jgi:hypothetical protein